jgi:hypothetical protein
MRQKYATYPPPDNCGDLNRVSNGCAASCPWATIARRRRFARATKDWPAACWVPTLDENAVTVSESLRRLELELELRRRS